MVPSNQGVIGSIALTLQWLTPDSVHGSCGQPDAADRGGSTLAGIVSAWRQSGSGCPARHQIDDSDETTAV